MAKYSEDVAKKIAELEAQIEALKVGNSRTLISRKKLIELSGKACYYDTQIQSLLSRTLRSIATGPDRQPRKLGETRIKKIEEFTDQEFFVLRNAADRILDILIEAAEEVHK